MARVELEQVHEAWRRTKVDWSDDREALWSRFTKELNNILENEVQCECGRWHDIEDTSVDADGINTCPGCVISSREIDL